MSNILLVSESLKHYNSRQQLCRFLNFPETLLNLRSIFSSFFQVIIYEITRLKSRHKRLREVLLPAQAQSLDVFSEGRLCVGYQSGFTIYSLLGDQHPLSLVHPDNQVCCKHFINISISKSNTGLHGFYIILPLNPYFTELNVPNIMKKLTGFRNQAYH